MLYESYAVTVAALESPTVTAPGIPVSVRVMADAGLTTIPEREPAIALFVVSAADSDCEPAVRRTTEAE